MATTIRRFSMRIENTELIFFSPTGSTRAVLEGIAEGLDTAVSVTDLTLPVSPARASESAAPQLAVLGVPVYAGRVPELAAARLRESVRGDGRPALLVVVYGNRAFEDALLELKELALELGFVPVAGAAFVGEHSFSTPETPVAPGRPDDRDRETARSFGRQARELLSGASDVSDLPLTSVPGNVPHRDGAQRSDIVPETDAALCVLCGECAGSCPSGAITLKDDAVETDAALCLRCCACIRVCPTQARVMPEKLREFSQMLFTKFSERREPEFFL